MSNKNVHILIIHRNRDIITRILQSNLIEKNKLEYKIKNSCRNEISYWLIYCWDKYDQLSVIMAKFL